MASWSKNVTKHIWCVQCWLFGQIGRGLNPALVETIYAINHSDGVRNTKL